MKKTIAVLGATGSVGTQSLEVAAARGYRVDLLAAGRNDQAMEDLARAHRPRTVVMADAAAAASLRLRLRDTDIRVAEGEAGLCAAIAESTADTVVNAVLGEAGLSPTLCVIESGKRLALANKESLVIAGALVMERAKACGVQILPVDSEHCAIFQCMKAGGEKEVRRLLLTASGGPFFGYTAEQLRTVTREMTLAHPTWRMGKKITVDSATLMNKGFEVLEASHLFGVEAERIAVVVHRESIIHSAVEYIDHSVVAQMAVPDMRMCVQYAVDYPNRYEGSCGVLDLCALGTLSFAKPDETAFPLLALARRAGMLGGGMGAVLNAADEEAVGAFLEGRIPFYAIALVVEDTFERLTHCQTAQTLSDILHCAKQARSLALEAIRTFSNP